MATAVSRRGRTKVQSVTVGKPIRRVTPSAGSIDDVIGVDTSGAVDGSALVFNDASGNFEATKDLDNTNVNGGQY